MIFSYERFFKRFKFQIRIVPEMWKRSCRGASSSTLRFMLPNHSDAAKGRLRILLTRISPFKPPFFTGNVATGWETLAELKALLLGSSFVPFLFGLIPQQIPGRSGYFIDGAFWSSLFVPWRCFSAADQLIRVTVFSGNPFADVSPPFAIPLWWVLLPPRPEVLWGLFWAGYRDMDQFHSRGESPGLSCVCRVSADKEKRCGTDRAVFSSSGVVANKIAFFCL